MTATLEQSSSVVERLKRDDEQAQQEYKSRVHAIAESTDPDSIDSMETRRIVLAAGRTLDDLHRHVERATEHRSSLAELSKCERSTALADLDTKLRVTNAAMVAEQNAHLKKMAELQKTLDETSIRRTAEAHSSRDNREWWASEVAQTRGDMYAAEIASLNAQAAQLEEKLRAVRNRESNAIEVAKWRRKEGTGGQAPSTRELQQAADDIQAKLSEISAQVSDLKQKSWSDPRNIRFD